MNGKLQGFILYTELELASDGKYHWIILIFPLKGYGQLKYQIVKKLKSSF